MSVQSKDSSERPRFTLVTGILTAIILVALALALRYWTTVQGFAVMATALAIAALDPFPIYFDPSGDLRLTTVIAIPTLVLFGWPTALLGAAAGIAIAFFYRPFQETAIRGVERLAGLLVAAV